jgi:hypothetical protein
VVVRFAVIGNSLLMRLPEYHEAVGYASNLQVCLRVDGTSGPTSERTSVEVRGRARRADQEEVGSGAEEALGERWPDGIRTHQLLLPLTGIVLLSEAALTEPRPPRPSALAPPNPYRPDRPATRAERSEPSR